MKRESFFLRVIEGFYEYGLVGFWSAFLLAVAIAAALTWLIFAAVRRRTRLYLPAFAVILAVIAVSVFAQLHQSRKRFASRNLDSVQLLSGYTLQHRSGDDTYVGSISRPGGLEISIDIGAMSGLWADPSEPEKHLWVFQQTIRGHTVFVGLRPYGDNNTEKLLCVTYPQGIVNFFAVVRSDQDVAEMLSMALTYEPLAT